MLITTSVGAGAPGLVVTAGAVGDADAVGAGEPVGEVVAVGEAVPTGAGAVAVLEGVGEKVKVGSVALTGASSPEPRRANPTSARSATTKATRPTMIHVFLARERLAMLQD